MPKIFEEKAKEMQPAPRGLMTAYAGQGMSLWRTLEEAEASFRRPTHYDGVARSPFGWWKDKR